MATLKNYRTILAIIDRTFTFHERRLVEIRKETVQHMRDLLTASQHSDPTLRLTPETESEQLPTA